MAWAHRHIHTFTEINCRFIYARNTLYARKNYRMFASADANKYLWLLGKTWWPIERKSSQHRGKWAAAENLWWQTKHLEEFIKQIYEKWKKNLNRLLDIIKVFFRFPLFHSPLQFFINFLSSCINASQNSLVPEQTTVQASTKWEQTAWWAESQPYWTSSCLCLY